MNTQLFPDPSHGAARSLDSVLKSSRLWDFWLLSIISWNLEWGPWQEEGRRNQLDEALERAYTGHPHQNPLFMTLVGDMVRELEQGEVILFPREAPIETELWTFLKSRPRSPVSGRRVALARFGGAYSAARKSMPWWSVMAWERTFLALESNMLRGTNLQATLQKKTAVC